MIGFDSFGRTWHRQEMLKARPVAGDMALGNSVVSRLEPWLFRRYLDRADETGIKALKRRIRTGERTHTNSCYLTFVAIDQNGQPRQIPKL